jgi:hypothetical protein
VVVPDDWKHACVCPIHKKLEKNKVSNYRPVSLTCIICKVLEKVIWDEMMDYLLDKNLITDKQYVFVQEKCTTEFIKMYV